MNVDVIIKMGFFIGDLHHHIEQLHAEQFGGQNFVESFTLYRGQGMLETEFEQMNKTKGGLVSFNNFLSTSKNRTISLKFAHRGVRNSDSVGILFVMTIDPSQSTTPFASIRKVSYYKDKEDEVLFAMHTIFRICDIKPMSENHRLFQVELTLTSDNDKDLRILTDRIREETFPDSEGWYRLGLVLLKMGHSDRAQQVYEILLKQTSNESDKAPIYNQLGRVKNNQGYYSEAITFYEKSLKIYQNPVFLNHPDLAMSYNNIGNVYRNMSEYSTALSYYEKALEIFRKILSPSHSGLAMSYNNIGVVYDTTGEYSKALWYYEKTLEIDQKTLPPNHPDLAKSYINIGVVYDTMGEYSKALSHYEKALEIDQKTLPSTHPDLAMCYNNIGAVYRKMSEYSKALSSHKKALEIKQQSLPPNHPDLGSSYNNIGDVYFNMGNYLDARSFYERAVDIGQHSLPSNHPILKQRQKSLDAVKQKL
jgi:tetratricopeptide (TPR) repeat protein